MAITCCQTLQAQSNNDHVSVNVDFESARAFVRLMNTKKADKTEILRTAGLPGNRQLIAKVKGYSGAGEDKIRMTLKEMIEMEGSANFVGDMLLIKNAGDFTKTQQALLKK